MEAKDLLDCDTWIFNVDGTVVEGRVAYAGKYIIKEEAKKLHLGTVLHAVLAVRYIEREVERLTGEKGKLAADNFGLEEYHKMLSRFKIEEKRVESATYEYLREHAIPGVGDLLSGIRHETNHGKKIPFFFSSTSSDWHVKPVNSYFSGDGYFANPVYEDGQVTILTKTPEHRVRLTGHDLGSCAVFGDSEIDLAFKKAGAKIFVASPLASPEVKRVADLAPDSYKDLLTIFE